MSRLSTDPDPNDGFGGMHEQRPQGKRGDEGEVIEYMRS